MGIFKNKNKSLIFYALEHLQLWALFKRGPTLAPFHASRHASHATLEINPTHPQKNFGSGREHKSDDHGPCSQVQKNESSFPL
jgi:hypothetical protein